MRLFYFICFTLLVGCGKLEITPSEGFDVVSPIDASDSLSLDYAYRDSVLSRDVLERAYQMANLAWTPVNPIPKIGGNYYPKGRTVTGIPYSSVKEINTYLFQDVSYHTFMTAVHNPRSVLYSENISNAPYHGRNCAPYYGAVCSSAVMYALGISIPYYANQIIKLPFMERITSQVVDSLRVCDVIWKSGHVQMIFGIEERADSLYRITTFEVSGGSAHLSDYSKEQFLKMWKNGRYVGYRYRYIRYSEEVTEYKGFDPIVYNDDLCPSKGDRSVYRTTDTVTVNIFNPTYDRIVLTNVSTGEEISADYSGEVYKYFDLQPGIYSVFLQNDDKKSSEVSFEIVETQVSYSGGDSEDRIVVYFHSSADPEYVALCYLWGSSTCYPISAADKELGYITIPRMTSPEYYCKVVFKGEFGRIINQPIRVF